MSTELEEFKNFAQHLSKLSGKIIREHFRTKIKVESKADSSPVTFADKKAEELMREEIMKEFPDHGILGEEFGNYNQAVKVYLGYREVYLWYYSLSLFILVQ